MMGNNFGMMGGYNLTGFILNLIVILIIVVVVVVLLNRSNYVSAGNEQLARMEKDLVEVKKTVEEIKKKLEEI